MRRMSGCVLLGCTAFALCLGLRASGQQSKSEKLGPGFGHRYLLLETNLASTMEQELQVAAGAGYRVIGGWSAYVLLLEQVASPPALYEYVLLSTMRRSTLEKEVKEASERGFRLVRQAALSGNTLVMEKAPGSPNRYDYLFLAHTFTPDPKTGKPLPTSLENVSLKAAMRGYGIVAVDCPSIENSEAPPLLREHIFIAEKSGPADAVTPELAERERYLIARVGGSQDLGPLLSDGGRKGYRLAIASQGSCPDLVVIMEDAGKPAPPFEYRVVSTQNALDAVAADGFYPHPSGLLPGVGVVMERNPGARGAGRYFLVEHKDAAVLQGRLIDAGVQNLDVLVTSRTRHSVILDKAADRVADVRAVELAPSPTLPAPAGSVGAAQWPRAFVRPMDGFEDYLISALKTKNVPVVLTFAPEDATLDISGAIKVNEPSKTIGFLNKLAATGAAMTGEKSQDFPRKLEAKIAVRTVKTGAVVFDLTVTKRSTLEAMPEYGQRAANDWAEEWAKKLSGAKQK